VLSQCPRGSPARQSATKHTGRLYCRGKQCSKHTLLDTQNEGVGAWPFPTYVVHPMAMQQTITPKARPVTSNIVFDPSQNLENANRWIETRDSCSSVGAITTDKYIGPALGCLPRSSGHQEVPSYSKKCAAQEPPACGLPIRYQGVRLAQLNRCVRGGGLAHCSRKAHAVAARAAS
jgi:hypothetical protein